MLHPHTGFSSQTPNANSREIGGRIIHRPIPVGAFQSRPPGGGLPQSYNMPPKASGQVDAAPISHWFHGNISREDTECLLKHNGANGTFLIRYSTSTQKYVLSVIYNQQLYHYPIEELLDGFYQVNGTNAKYLGIDLLVSEFRRANNCIVCSLGKPIFGSKPPPHITVYGCTNELHHAVRKGNLKGVRDLLNRVAASNISISEYVNEKSADSGATPLIEAAKTGSNDIVRLLLDLGAQVNLRDCGGFTALHRACQKSFAHVAETLLRANSSSSSSSTPTGGGVLSTGGGGGANPQIKCPFSGNTALHEAAMLGHADCVNCLLECHAAPWARNADLEMPFELALRFGFAELANALASYQPAPPLTSQSDWYHPNLSKSDTERVLAAAASSTTGTLQDGTFLVRRSSQSERKFVLVLHYRGQSLKYQIEVVDFSFHLDTKEAYFIDKGPFHLSLEHFVEHYSRFADGIPTRLRYAVSPSGRVLNMERLLVSGIPSSSAAAAAAANTTTPPTTAGAQGRGDLVKVGGGVGHRGAPLMMHGHAFVSGRPKSQSASKRNSSSSSGMSSSGVAGAAGSGALVPAASSAAAASVLGGGSTELRLIPSDAVILLYRLGEGEFGEVYCGKLHLDNGVTQDVAVKVLVQPCQRLDFLKEASIMMRLSHENIVTIHGVCENKRLMMILELAELGSLLDFMLDYPERCQLPELYNWAMQIASGMSYLESAGFVHRDLACRNVLLASQSCAKISDFGLSRAVGVESDYYKATQRGKWPVKWYAPESIYYKTFSTASDVWSFGVCLWEMFSLGEHPYAEQDSFEVLRQLEEGVRLPRPRLASDEVYGVMLDCWAYAPEARPKFAHLLAIFRHLATNVYENVAAPAAAVVTAAAGKANGSGGVGEGRTK